MPLGGTTRGAYEAALMTSGKDFKSIVRDRARRAGLSYTAARRLLLSEAPASRRGKESNVKGWSITGSHKHEYELSTTDERIEGKRVALLRSKVENPGGFGAQVQSFLAEKYLGKRVRFSGVLRTDSVDGWAGLWMRVDGHDTHRSGESLAFDNMEDRSLSGTTEWTPCNIVLEVSDEALRILVGTILSGKGAVYMAGFNLEVVGDDVPTTGPGRITREEPVNLDFEED